MDELRGGKEEGEEWTAIQYNSEIGIGITQKSTEPSGNSNIVYRKYFQNLD